MGAADVIVGASGCISSPLASVAWRPPWQPQEPPYILIRRRYLTSTLKTEEAAKVGLMIGLEVGVLQRGSRLHFLFQSDKLGSIDLFCRGGRDHYPYL